MFGEIIAIGEEVLAGDVINSNAATLSSRLSEIGVFCRFHSVVGDIIDDIVEQLEIAVTRSEVIVLCGGLGPTEDDLTREAVARFADRDLIEVPELRQEIQQWFFNHDREPSENNFKQAKIIEGGKSLKNTNGTAPGVYVQAFDSHIFLLPGPPGELLPMYNKCVEPIIKPLVLNKIVTKTIKLINIGESSAVTILEDMMTATDTFILAPYAKLHEVHLKMTAIGPDLQFLNARIRKTELEIIKRLGDYIYSIDDRDLVEVVVDLLKKHKLTIGTAESCTGGLIAESFVQKPGVSSVFMQGVITYSNQSKTDALGVDKSLIDTYGAVSQVVAREMAKGVMEKFKVDAAISVTGIAGPTGGSEEKPVGLVYIGIGLKDNVKVFKYNFLGNRDKIRKISAKRGLIHLYQALLELNKTN